MILPIVAYGDPVLRKVCKKIDADFPKLDLLIANMRETMYNASGVGLAAPQIGKPIRLFIIDASPFGEDEDFSEEDREILKNFNRVFINAQILTEEGDEWVFNEGCLSIPDIREDVFRQEKVHIEYEDENFEKHTEVLTGIAARVFQHEYDHIEGILFTDKLSTLKKRILKKKLENISKGKINADYRMRFPKLKNKK
ncbi:peptide deformylase [Polaribacter sp.]|uniref:peptide deformylase n=1 Tax=Polaribacter sp. TaxID=1920175 RepID=UPI003EFB2728